MKFGKSLVKVEILQLLTISIIKRLRRLWFRVIIIRVQVGLQIINPGKKFKFM